MTLYTLFTKDPLEVFEVSLNVDVTKPLKYPSRDCLNFLHAA